MHTSTELRRSSDRSTETINRWIVPLLLLSVILSFMLAILISVATTWVLSELRHQQDEIQQLQRWKSTRQQLEDRLAGDLRARLDRLEENHASDR